MADVIVLGAGIAGISATYHLHGLADVVCYESQGHVGGLVANFTIDGFRFDNAIHLSFTSIDYVKNLFSKVPHYKHAPEAYCSENGKWLRHPVQNNLYPLSTEEKINLIASFYNAPKDFADNYHSWLISQYGREIAERYHLKYTTKYWGLDASSLSLSWIGNRLRKADISEILKGAFEARTDNHYYADEMRYPVQGGYFSFVKPMLEKCRIDVNKRAVKIDPLSKRVSFSDGTYAEYEKLISTLPLPEIVKILENVPSEVEEAADSLLYTRVDLVSVGFSKIIENRYLWFYIYDSCMAARAYSPSLKSPASAPPGCSSLQFEIYSLSTQPKHSKQSMIESVRSYLIKNNFCKADDILFMNHKCLEYGNVVYDHGMEKRRNLVLSYLASLGILTAGRFGEWSYLWSDQSLMSGKSAADRIVKIHDGKR